MSREALRAILKGDIGKFDDYVQEGMDVNEKTEKEKWNYLHRALMSVAKPPKPEMVQHLIGLGVDVNAVDEYGNTPLHYAIRLKNAELIKILLDANAEINHVNEEGVSPLRQALLAKPFDYNSIKLLLDAGADIEQKTDTGITVKEFAETVANDPELVDLFKR